MKVSDIWPRGFPQDLADYAGLFTPARFVAYSTRVARPEDTDLTLFRRLVSGMSEPYQLKDLRVETTIDNIVEWVVDPNNRAYVRRVGSSPQEHLDEVIECARRSTFRFAAPYLQKQGQSAQQIGKPDLASALGQCDGHCPP